MSVVGNDEIGQPELSIYPLLVVEYIWLYSFKNIIAGI